METLSDKQLSELKILYDKFKQQSEIPLKSESEDVTSPLNSGDSSKIDVIEKQYAFIFSALDDLLAPMTKGSQNYLQVLAMKSSLYYELAKSLLNNNSIDKSKTFLVKAVDLITEYENEPQIAFLYMRIANYLAYVLSILGDLIRARSVLETVLKKERTNVPIVYTTEELFLNNCASQNNATSKINKIVINNMQILGWVYAKLGMNDLHVDIVHKGLQKEFDMNEGDSIEWAERCFRLASLFITQNKWKHATYHLAVAQHVLDSLEASATPSSCLFKVQADLARVWINYGLHLFSCSKKSVFEKIWDETDENRSRTSENAHNFKFTGMEFTEPNVPITEITNLEEAKQLFKHTHLWLKRARFFYSLRDHPLQYVNIMLELSELYRFLAFYEKSIEEEYEIQKKRYETLETLSSLVKEIRPACYFTVNVEIIKEIMEVQIEMMNINLKKLYRPNMEAKLSQDDLRKRIFTVIDMSAKLNTICTENKDERSDLEADSMVEPDLDEQATTDDDKPNIKSNKLDDVSEQVVSVEGNKENSSSKSDENDVGEESKVDAKQLPIETSS